MPELEKSIACFGKSICIQGNDEETWRNMPEELRQAIIGYYQGKGMPLRILDKYYGFRSGFSIVPSEAELRAAAQAPF